MKKWLIDRGGALVLVIVIMYLVLAPDHVVDGDNAEFSTVGAIGGRPHPSGYPAYVLYLRAMSWLPGSPAHTAAIATALLGVAVVAVLFAACRAWGARPGSAAIACAMYAASPVVLRMHTEAEVFALNALVVAAILLLAAERGPVRGAWRGLALGLVAGIGLGNHLTCVLVAPIGILGAVRAIREAPRARYGPALAAIGGLAVGLASYAYLVVADGPASFGVVDDLGGVLRMFLRADYGGPGAFVPGGKEVATLSNLVAFAATLGRATLIVPGLGGLAMLGVAAWRPAPGRESVWAWRALLASLVLAGPLLVARFNIEPVGLGRYVVSRFHLLPLLLLVPAVAVAMDRVPLRATIATVAACVAVVVLAGIDLPLLRAQHSVAMQRGVENLMRSLPQRAVMLSQSDDVCATSEYLQAATGLRPDVDVVCWIVTSRDWYRARLAAHGLPLAHRFTPQPSLAEADAILASGRPLFTDRNAHELLAGRPNYPYGIATRVLAAGRAIPSPGELVQTNRALFETFDRDYPDVGTDDDWATIAQRRYAVTWLVIAEALARNGDVETAAEARALAAQLAPH